MRGHSGPHAADLLVAALQARPGLDGVSVLREYPTDPGDLRNAAGEYDAVWPGRNGTQDVTDIEVKLPFAKSGPVVWDEEYTLWVTIQVLRNDTDGTQKIASDRAVEILGELVGAIAADPSLGFADTDDLSTFWCRTMTNLHRTGRLDAGHGAGFEVGLRFRCRLHLS